MHKEDKQFKCTQAFVSHVHPPVISDTSESRWPRKGTIEVARIGLQQKMEVCGLLRDLAGVAIVGPGPGLLAVVSQLPETPVA